MDPIEELKKTRRKKETIEMYQKHLEEMATEDSPKHKTGKLGTKSVKLNSESSKMSRNLFQAKIPKSVIQ